MEASESRYSSRAFPPYAYLPGAAPHPTRDPDGHSFQGPESPRIEPPADCPPDAWATCDPYLYGVDLYNAGFYWEAHESWEELWHRSKGRPHQAQFIQGLIQCSASLLKVRMRQPKGVQRLGEQGLARLRATAQAEGPIYMGLDIETFSGAFTECIARDQPLEASPRIQLTR